MWGPGVLWWSLAAGLGPLAGFLVARASLALPAEAAPPTPGPRRLALAISGCTLGAIWSAALFDGPLALVSALLGWILVLIAFLDAEHFWLPHRLTVPLALLGMAEAAAFEPERLLERLIGAAVGFGALAFMALAYRRLRGREGIGGGDFRLLAAAGAWVGWIGLPSVLVIAAVSGLLVVGLLRLAGRRMEAATEVPFGVYLALGLWLTWLYGPLGRAGY